MEKKTRQRFSDAEKVAILRRHLLKKEPIPQICDEVGLQPTQFYRWQKTFFENGTAAFQTKPRGDRCSPSINQADARQLLVIFMVVPGTLPGPAV